MPNKPATHRPPSVNVRHRAQGRGWKPSTKEQSNARTLRSTARWQRYRDWMLKRYPICMAPWCNRRTPATQVHHIVELVVDLAQAYIWRNTPTICSGCHGLASAKERAGKDAATEWERWWER